VRGVATAWANQDDEAVRAELHELAREAGMWAKSIPLDGLPHRQQFGERGRRVG
jgi:hypothetical protein